MNTNANNFLVCSVASRKINDAKGDAKGKVSKLSPSKKKTWKEQEELKQRELFAKSFKQLKQSQGSSRSKDTEDREDREDEKATSTELVLPTPTSLPVRTVKDLFELEQQQLIADSDGNTKFAPFKGNRSQKRLWVDDTKVLDSGSSSSDSGQSRSKKLKTTGGTKGRTQDPFFGRGDTVPSITYSKDLSRELAKLVLKQLSPSCSLTASGASGSKTSNDITCVYQCVAHQKYNKTWQTTLKKSQIDLLDSTLKKLGVKTRLEDSQFESLYWMIEHRMTGVSPSAPIVSGKSNGGGILALPMGFGKSLVAIACGLLMIHYCDPKGLNALPKLAHIPRVILLVSPYNVLSQWVKEFNIHTTLKENVDFVQYYGTNRFKVTIGPKVKFVLTTYECVRQAYAMIEKSFADPDEKPKKVKQAASASAGAKLAKPVKLVKSVKLESSTLKKNILFYNYTSNGPKKSKTRIFGGLSIDDSDDDDGGDDKKVSTAIGNLNNKSSEMIQDRNFLMTILDEGQMISNRETKRTKAIYKVPGYFRWCMTGTPICNSSKDLASICTFIENQDSCSSQTIGFFSNLSKPQVQEWKKEYVFYLDKQQALNLPDLTVYDCIVSFTAEERSVYYTVAQEAKKEYNNFMYSDEKYRKQHHRMNLLVWLLRLNQCSSDPALMNACREGREGREDRKARAEENRQVKIEKIKAEQVKEVEKAEEAKAKADANDVNAADDALKLLRELEKEDLSDNDDNDNNDSDHDHDHDDDNEYKNSKAKKAKALKKVKEIDKKANLEYCVECNASCSVQDVHKYIKLKCVHVMCTDCVKKMSSAFIPSKHRCSLCSVGHMGHGQFQVGLISSKTRLVLDLIKAKLECVKSTTTTTAAAKQENEDESERLLSILALPKQETKAKALDRFKELKYSTSVQEPNVKHKKIVVFSRWIGYLEIVQDAILADPVLKQFITQKSIVCLNGEMSKKDRDLSLQRFNQEESVTIFLSTIKCGGLGLNLVAASMEIICDQWWNPSVEDQAQDRVHRKMQKRNVEIFRVKTDCGVEKALQYIKSQKRNLIEKFRNGDGGKTNSVGAGLSDVEVSSVFQIINCDLAEFENQEELSAERMSIKPGKNGALVDDEDF